jgi:hypothetical protein
VWNGAAVAYFKLYLSNNMKGPRNIRKPLLNGVRSGFDWWGGGGVGGEYIRMLTVQETTLN